MVSCCILCSISGQRQQSMQQDAKAQHAAALTRTVSAAPDKRTAGTERERETDRRGQLAVVVAAVWCRAFKMRELCASAANVDNRIVLHSRPLNLRNEFYKISHRVAADGK